MNSQPISSDTSGIIKLFRESPNRPSRVVLQNEQAECGLACITAIVSAHGLDIDLNSMRKQYPVSMQGMDLSDVIDVFASLGLSARAIRAETEELDQIQLPALLHWDINHFVVLTKKRNDQFTVMDPSRGEVLLQLSEFNLHFTGIVVEVTKTEDFDKGNYNKKLRLSDLWTNVIGLKRSLFQIIAITFALHFVTILSPLYLQLVVDQVVSTEYWDWLVPIAIGFSLLVLTQAAISFLRSFAILHLSKQLSLQMGANLFFHLIRLPFSFFSRRHVGDIVSRFGSLRSVRDMITGGLVTAILDGAMTIITLAILFYYSTTLTMITLMAVSLYTLLRISLYRKIRLLSQDSIIASANENSFFLETLRAVQSLKLFQKEGIRQAQWATKFSNHIDKEVQLSKWNTFTTNASNILFGIENIAVIFLAALLVRDNQFSLGMLFAFVSFKSSFTISFNNLITQSIEFKLLDIHLERLSDIAFTNKEPASNEASLDKDSRIEGNIKVVNLGYQFEGEKDFAFRNVSFEVEKGESLAITGPSGCGKSTLIKCLMGLYEPTEGEILIDGKPLKSIPHYRGQISGVMQDDQLVSGSIRDNIAFFSESPDGERIKQCATNACIHRDIEKMTMGYETLIGDLGSNLSGGQKQRVILARALYRTPQILFMDEATSHLDTDSESVVSQNIGKLSITRVLVAHRPETVRSAGKQFHLAGNPRHTIHND